MMNELSLNILDIAQNSITAEATLVEIDVEEDNSLDRIIIKVHDNGRGMSEDFQGAALNPFVTTRTTRKIGLGISFLKEAAEITGGAFELKSELGIGTTITATFVMSHIDRQPIGNLTETVITLVTLNTEIDFIIRYRVNESEFELSTQEVKALLGEDVEISSPSVVVFLTEYVKEHIKSLSGEGT